MSKSFDVIVIGAGPGGYIAAIRAAQLGYSVACIEQWQDPRGEFRLGGTCLNVGCIPSKALLASSELFENTAHHVSGHGIAVQSVAMDVARMMARKDGIVNKMTKGIEFLFRKNKIHWLKGHGRFVSASAEGIQIEVSGAGEAQTVTGRNVIIATGSKARHLPNVQVDQRLVVDNEGALAFESVPRQLAVIGAGVIGLELGSVWRRLGAQVKVLEASPAFLPAADDSVSKEAFKLFSKQGLSIELGVKIEAVNTRDQSVAVSYADASGQSYTFEANRLIVAVGRVPNTDGLGLENIGLNVNERGFIDVDDHCRTRAPNIYAIGDVVRGPMLAHKAEDEGVMVAEIIDGQKPHLDLNCIPWVIYTAPEIAWVGNTEQQLKREGRAYKTGQFPFAANGRALGIGHADGFVKMLADARSDEILGVHIVSSNASDLIAEAVSAMEFKAASEDIARICHPHPSLSEAMREAALAVEGRALNI
ncbi:Dihydrolipoyl dehydrogenase (E3 component of 2-oxoglutarate dehydrogenase complex) (Dihydrolipoamide dehydrogenase) [Candidatus Glomeribacter gigasporarum BEG34]|uniref:Dihydrolipoyl dehydrogenase n=1 Tax=Candidatus Glomeribacter gigasporarum BEG34 TaxID=1070319 RepID=G2J8H4_9BURK|nr:dihydrolipoyl dehydrogenase [Candidatus Glomeribacter gigasporarum]CCD29071.1 Dihydrolipoyl dehydrogenase (E3 component of 2-oxoglutarate dehydrogenase complex) (Dihydrolipoamide dehydrogenase) [Candidatus Glomeribacter gigasporarum BEG34]